MKKIRFIPYGYSVRDGHTVIDHKEAEIIQEIFKEYITGASLKDIAEDLSQRKIPYTEKTDVWDKARVSRIIENAKYLGDGEYDPIIDEATFERASACKAARQNSSDEKELSGISTIRNRMHCEACGSTMMRKVNSQRRIRESWVCSNPECGCRVRISDADLLRKVTILLNRIIENSELIIPSAKGRRRDSPTVAVLKGKIEEELNRENPSEEYVVALIGDIANTLYKETQANKKIAAMVARKRVTMMNPQESFNEEYFSDLISFISIDTSGRIILHTKTETEISEESTNGSQEDS